MEAGGQTREKYIARRHNEYPPRGDLSIEEDEAHIKLGLLSLREMIAR